MGRMRVGATVAVIAASAVWLTACSGATPPPPTVRVDRGDISTSVSASGTLTTISQQNLGFPDRGKLAEVMVKVGDKVTQGQPLARLDDFALRKALDQANAKVAQQQAALDKITKGNAVDAAAATLGQAQSILAATQAQAAATADADNSAVDRAHTQLDFDRKALDKAKDQLDDDRNACNSSGGTQNASSSTQSTADPSASGTQSGSGDSSACSKVTTDENAVETARRTVVTSQTAVDSAEQKRNVDEASSNLSIENAKQSVVNAQNNSTSAASDRPANINNQAAMVRDAQAAAALAQRNLDDAVLKAPLAGVVSAVNGSAGEYVGAAAGTTAQAPGSSARKPADTSAAAGAGAAAASGLIVLNNVDSYQLVVPFAESDAAQVTPNQRVDVSVDALGGTKKSGTVLAIAPAGASQSGVVSYNATIVLDQGDPALRDGQTAQADVLIKSVTGLRVPSAAVRNQDGKTLVDLPGPNNAKVPTPFTAGLVGREFTEVTAGLAEGQEILLPQAKVASAGAAGPR